MPSAHFTHLSNRCGTLIKKFAEPSIQAELDALEKDQQIPDVDIDDVLALRLIAHAELEYYFEEIARAWIESQRENMAFGQTGEQSSLVFLYLQHRRLSPQWSDINDANDEIVKVTNDEDFEKLLLAALDFAIETINNNEGIKSSSITLLASLAGKFPGQISETLVTELDRYGREYGEIAHSTWKKVENVNIESATIEKRRVEEILQLIKSEFES